MTDRTPSEHVLSVMSAGARRLWRKTFPEIEPSIEVGLLTVIAQRARADAPVSAGFIVFLAVVASGPVASIAAPSFLHALQWGAVALSWPLIASITARRFLASENPESRLPQWRLVFSLSYMIYSFAWASSLYFLWTPGSIENNAFLIIATLAVITVFVVDLSLHRMVFLAASLVFIGLVFSRLVTGGTGLTMAIAVLFPGFCLWVAYLARETSRRTLESMQRAHALSLMTRHLQEAKVEAEVSSRAKTSFLATMSHELRTPLNAIIGFSEIMARELFGAHINPKYRSYAEDIHRSGQHLLSLVNDVLDMSKIETGKMELREEGASLSRLVAECVRFFNHRAAQKGVHLELQPAQIAFDVLVDVTRIKQALLNLVSNAVKFTPKGGRVLLRILPAAGDVVIEVEDTGIGIDKADLERVFEAFQQVDSHLTRNHEGTGLGLPISRALVELHGGDLTLESRLNVGTTGRIRLPASRIVARSVVVQARIA